MRIIRQVTLDSARRKKDRSVSFTFTTSLEQSSKEFIEIDELLGDNGILHFKSQGNLTSEEIKELDSFEIEVEGKTKSQRLRNVLYILHQQTQPEQDFNSFYSENMEKIIEHYKSKLEK